MLDYTHRLFHLLISDSTELLVLPYVGADGWWWWFVCCVSAKTTATYIIIYVCMHVYCGKYYSINALLGLHEHDH